MRGSAHFPGRGRVRAGAYLAEGDFAVARAILGVSDKHFSVVLYPALATQDVVNTGRHLVPLKVVPKPERERAHGAAVSQP